MLSLNKSSIMVCVCVGWGEGGGGGGGGVYIMCSGELSFLFDMGMG